jgi:PAS domain S-box-containing protein
MVIRAAGLTRIPTLRQVPYQPGPPAQLAFLAGGGEMGRRMRGQDWTRTPLGPPDGWPQGLKTLVGLMLASEQPMFLAWGEAQTWLYNDAFIPIMGVKHPALLARGAITEVWSEAREVLEPMFRRVFAGEPVHLQDFGLMLDRGGRLEEAHFAFSYTPVRDEGGRIVGLFGACIELTERVRAEQALREADRRKDAFLATLAHELRNPLAPIRHAVRIARAPNASAEQLRWSHEVIERQASHMALLLDDLLDMSRISRGQLRLRKTVQDLGALVDQAVEAARPLLEARKHRLEISLPPGRLAIEADGLRLSQVISNLLTNAAKYTDAGGRIELAVRDDAGTLVIAIRDDGIGLDAEIVPRLFEMFAQSQAALERAEGGFGIGLPLVKGLVELHGGTITAHSAGPGKGSEFTVTLPGAVRAGEAPRAAAAEMAKAAAQKRILVVDDNIDAGQALQMLLQIEGHKVGLAHDGEEAVTAVGSEAPDVVFLDIGMPRVNGYEAARRIRALPAGQGVKLVALTGWGQPGDRERAAQAGFDMHLTKPVAHEALRELLHRL